MKRMPMTEGNNRACIEGRKMQSRRVWAAQVLSRFAQLCPGHQGAEELLYAWGEYEGADEASLTGGALALKRGLLALPSCAVGEVVALTLPHWRNGKLLWDAVTEQERCEDPDDDVLYGGKISGAALDIDLWTERPPMFMPVWACRHFVRITSVRAMRVQDISDLDAVAEGMVEWDGWHWPGDDGGAREAFAAEWNSIHGPGAWERNDPVWAYTFKLTEKP